MGKVLPFRRRGITLTLLNSDKWVDLMKPDQVLGLLEHKPPPAA